MNPMLADAIGLVGSALMVVAYAYSNMAKSVDFLLFNLLNLVGSLLLIASLLVHFNLASMLLEIVWSIIALLGLAKVWMTRAKA
ncbi:hypothetical protein Q4F19_00330 [Sphingomonas sp. BIUV-7]|uniref:CBU-0592-like domain-containing protein n=1 Tax=Sphingomonas natans TaxID=3063330 RepID=A0ABT8Y3D1_9SPHN|nr:hypothetical protein [Sphingomonas sp. BIUV-7]MDO6412817.1 hypothetical protein [Sphingomonas sp. BIUV-7]